jgi:hypothetical protein
MYILSKHSELSTQINIHEIVERCCSRTLAPNSPNFIFFYLKKIMQLMEKTKRKRIVLSEHESKTCLAHVTNTNGFSKRFEPASIKRFGEDISQLIFCGNKHKSYFPGFDKVTDEMMLDVDVLGPKMLNWIL